MSHNTLKVGDLSASSNGNINVSLNELSDVSISVSDQKVLRFNGSAWIASFLPAVFRSNGYAVGWSDTSKTNGTQYTATGSLDSYRNFSNVSWGGANAPKFESGNITLNRGTHGGVTPTNERYSRVELNANGKYLLIATTKTYMSSSSSWVKWQWLDTATDEKLSPISKQYGSTKTRGNISFIVGYVEVTNNSRVCDIRCIATNGTNDDRATNLADIIGAVQLA